MRESSSAPGGQDPRSEREQGTKLPEILVTGRLTEKGVPVVPFDSVGSRNIFGPDQVRETGARDVNDLLLHIPALSTRPYNGGEAAAPSFSMRGLPDDGLTEYIHLLIDGVPASPLPYGWTAPSFFPLSPERIHAIDYIRGGHSVRYSPNTVGGVLNFITRPIPEDPEVEFRSTYGDFDYSSNMVTGGSTDGKLGWSATYVDRRGDGYRKDGEFHQQDMNFKLRRELDPGDWLAVSLTYMENEHMAPGGLTPQEFAQDRFGNARPMNRFQGYRGVADVVLHQELDADTWVETFTYLSQTRRNLIAQRPQFPNVGDVLTLSDWKDDSYVIGVGSRMEHRYDALGMEHTLYGGIRYQREWIPNWEIETRPFLGGTGTTTQEDEYLIEAFSIHLDDTFRPVERLEVTAGVRFEWVPTAEGENRTGGNVYRLDQDYSTLLPGVGAAYRIADDWAVFANYHEGFRAPQVWGFGLTPDPANADLDFESADTAEVGIRFDDQERLAASVTAWRNRYGSFFVFYSGFYEDLGEIEAEGVDVEAEYRIPGIDGLSALASVTFQESTLESGPNAGNEVPYAWETKAAWRLRYESESGWLASLGGTYVGDSFSDDANTVDQNATGNIGLNGSRVLWDAQLGREWSVGESGRFRAAVGATNLFDEDWSLHSRGGFFGGGLVAGPPRQTYLALTFNTGF